MTLNATLHTVHGKFLLRRGELRFEAGTGQISGEIVFDATSGKSRNDGRDRKCTRTVLESAKYPDISFRPDRVEGKVAESGTSTDQVRFERDRWMASTHVTIPHGKWGMNNPSNLVVHVGDSVEVAFQRGGHSRQKTS